MRAVKPAKSTAFTSAPASTISRIGLGIVAPGSRMQNGHLRRIGSIHIGTGGDEQSHDRRRIDRFSPPGTAPCGLAGTPPSHPLRARAAAALCRCRSPPTSARSRRALLAAFTLAPLSSSIVMASTDPTAAAYISGVRAAARIARVRIGATLQHRLQPCEIVVANRRVERVARRARILRRNHGTYKATAP